MINRAYGQIKLYLNVTADAKKQSDYENDKKESAHLNLLSKLARKKILLSNKEDTVLHYVKMKKLYENYKREYLAGERWSDFVEVFGGDGIVILFINSGTSEQWGRL